MNRENTTRVKGDLARKLLLISITCASLCASASAQMPADSAAPSPPPRALINLTANDWGIVIGNAPRVHGLRFNLSDRGIEQIDGLNVTFWKPRETSRGVINGVALGLLAPAARHINGISLGTIATVGESSLRGISAAAIATVSEGVIQGVSAAGIAVIGEQRVTGITAAGIAVISNGKLIGVSASGLATIGRTGLWGVHAAGLATVSEGDAFGVTASGLATVCEGGLHGIGAAGLAIVTEGAVDGVALAGLTTVCDGTMTGIAIAGGVIITEQTIRGLAVGGIALPSRVDDESKRWSLPGIKAREIRGLAVHGMNIQVSRRASGILVSGIHLSGDVLAGIGAAPVIRAGELKGIGAGLVNLGARRQTGIMVGLLNSTPELRGIQVGLLNHAGNNPKGFQWLPGINLHF